MPGVGISRKTGYKLFERYREEGPVALADRSRRPVRYANQLPVQVEMLIIACKREKPYWGARKIREVLVRRLAGDVRIAGGPCVHSSSRSEKTTAFSPRMIRTHNPWSGCNGSLRNVRPIRRC